MMNNHFASIKLVFNVARFFSSSAAPSQALNKKQTTFRNLVKPFLLKCHPDLQTSPQAKQINLQAVQNLNSYLDMVEERLSGKVKRPSDQKLLQVDFILLFDETKSRKKILQNSTRRCVELVLPSLELSHDQVKRQVWKQLCKLLQMAGLSVPTSPLSTLEDDDEEDDIDGNQKESQNPNFKSVFGTRYQQTRQTFVNRVNWNKYHNMLDRMLVDGWTNDIVQKAIRKNPNYKKQLIAQILARLEIKEETYIDEQLIAIRRLTLLMQDYFEDLKMDTLGNLWERTTLVLTPPRGFNASSSALHKRRRKLGETGMVFVLHADATMTVHIPLDFRDEEFVSHFKANLPDFTAAVQGRLADLVDNP